jgi:hypothetical protein
MKIYSNKTLTALSITIMLGITSQASATLIKRTDNLVYDDISNITWLADVQYAKTSGFDNDSKMNWSDSIGWAANLDVFGYSNWRLASLTEGNNLQSSSSDFGLFANIPSSTAPFWTSSVDTSINTDKAYLFKLNGDSGFPLKTGEKFTWAVIDGDIANLKANATVSEPATMAIFTLGLAGLAFRRKQLKID